MNDMPSKNPFENVYSETAATIASLVFLIFVTYIATTYILRGTSQENLQKVEIAIGFLILCALLPAVEKDRPSSRIYEETYVCCTRHTPEETRELEAKIDDLIEEQVELKVKLRMMPQEPPSCKEPTIKEDEPPVCNSAILELIKDVCQHIKTLTDDLELILKDKGKEANQDLTKSSNIQ